MRKLIIIGAGGFGREVLWLAREINRTGQGYEVLGFLDDKLASGSDVNGVKVLGGLDRVPDYVGDSSVHFVIALGEPGFRKRIADSLAQYGPQYATLVHPDARGDWERIQIGQGTIICAGVILTTNITLGDHVILNLMDNVGHDTTIHSYSTLAPNVTVSGSVTLGEGCYVGSSATIRDEVQVGDWSIVGMGAAVTKPVPAEVVVAGVPAKVIRPNTDRRVW